MATYVVRNMLSVGIITSVSECEYYGVLKLKLTTGEHVGNATSLDYISSDSRGGEIHMLVYSFYFSPSLLCHWL
jgi:hypothetical protein